MLVVVVTNWFVLFLQAIGTLISQEALGGWARLSGAG